MNGENESTATQIEAVAQQRPGSGPIAHTPGPWCFGVTHTWPHGQPELKKLSLNIHGGDGQDGYAGNIIAVVAPDDHISDQDKANARLIAAAPELFEACQFMENLTAVWVGTPDQARGAEMMRAAIAKALGQNAADQATAGKKPQPIEGDQA